MNVILLKCKEDPKSSNEVGQMAIQTTVIPLLVYHNWLWLHRGYEKTSWALLWKDSCRNPKESNTPADTQRTERLPNGKVTAKSQSSWKQNHKYPYDYPIKCQVFLMLIYLVNSVIYSISIDSWSVVFKLIMILGLHHNFTVLYLLRQGL